MEINATLTGDLGLKAVKFYNETGARMATASLRVKVKEEDAKATLGEVFHSAAFAGMQLDDEGNAKFPYKQFKPELVCQSHTIKLLKHKARAIPEIPQVKPAEDNAPAVIVDIELPLPCSKLQRDMIGDIAVAVGTVCSIRFDVSQQPLPLEDPGVTKKTGAHGNVVPVKS